MAEFDIGNKVIEIGTNRRGTIVGVDRPTRAGQTYQVIFLGEFNEETIDESFLQPSYDVSDPFARCLQKIYGSYSDFSRINTSFKIENSNNNTISSLKASKTIFKSYQFKPLLKFLNSDNNRLLIADEVGLGKTIEAGHIMLEMKARNELRNVLIICPVALQEKWRSELKEKFNLGFTIYENKKDIIDALTINDGAFRGIINYEKIRMPKSDTSSEDGSMLGFIRSRGIRFSLVLCDEAHRMRNRETQTYKGVEQLMRQAKAGVFLTATPIMISEKNLYNLLHLLDENEYYSDVDFTNSLELNKPFLKALRQIRNLSITLPQIASELCSAEVTTIYERNGTQFTFSHVVSDVYANDPLFQQCIKCMREDEDTKMLRAKLQYDLTSMSDMSNIFSRTRKRDITTDWSQAERRPFPIEVELAKEERKYFDEVIDQYIDDNSYVDVWGDIKMSQGASLGLVTKKRQVASSVYAYMNTEEDLDKGIDRYADMRDAKVERLIEIIEKAKQEGEEKIIVFALFKKTLKYLAIRLRSKGYECAVIHGDIDNRDEVIQEFKNNENIHVLLSSEVGSEGLDMQFCCSMVNYDLPWNPMVVEQRIGRIDRFGQKSEIVKIFNLIVSDSIQEEIYERLLKRIGIFRNSIGDLEAILDANFETTGMSIRKAYTQLEKDLFTNKLTQKEREQKYAEIAQAIENEKENAKRIEEGLTNTLTNDYYFQQEIDRILKHNAFVTERELINFVEMMIDEALPTCSLQEAGDHMYEFIIPKSSPRLLVQFLNQYHPHGEEFNVQLQTFKNRVDGKTKFLLTFNQEKAFDDKTLIFVNLYHPIVQAALGFFKQKNDDTNKSFMFSISKEYLPVGLFSSLYFLAIFEISVQQIVHGVKKEISTLVPVLYDCTNEETIANEDVASQFFGIVQKSAQYAALDTADYPDAQLVNEMKGSVVKYIGNYRLEKHREIDIHIRSRREKKLKQLDERQKFVTEPLKQRIKEYENIVEGAYMTHDEELKIRTERMLPMARGQLRQMEENFEEKRQDILRDPELSVKEKPVSINLVKVI